RRALDAPVLHAEDRAVPRALDLAAIASDPLPLVERPTGVGADVRDGVDRAIDLCDEDLGTGLGLADDRLAVLEILRRDGELLPLRRVFLPRLAVHLRAVPVRHLAAEERAHEHDRPAQPRESDGERALLRIGVQAHGD